MPQTDIKYQVIYIVPSSKYDCIDSDPLFGQIKTNAFLSIINIGRDTQVDLPVLYNELVNELDRNVKNLPVIVIIHAFLRLEEEGVNSRNVWDPPEDKIHHLLAISAREKALLSLRLYYILKKKLRADTDIYITTNKLHIAAWRQFDISSAFHDRELCTIYHWDDDSLVSRLGSRIRQKFNTINTAI